MRRSYLSNCQPGDVVEDVYVLSQKQFSATSTGKFFVKAFISDKTLQLTARLWNATRDLYDRLPESGFVKIRGRIENYQSNLQFIIEQIWPAKDGTFDVGDLLPHTTKDVDAMCQRLFELVQSVQNRHLNALLQTYLDDEELMNSFCKAPAAMTFHHAFVGGLLEHTLNAIEVADAICKFYPGLNRDIVIAGIFLHDIAKTWELSYDCAFGYTDGGQLVGHIVKSAMWVEHKAKIAEDLLGEKIPQPLIDVLQHIIISHHGVPEFGAIKPPSTPEAIMVHVVENLDAKMMMSLAATRGSAVSGFAADGGGGNWTEYMKAFGGRLYRPDTAPADAEIPDGNGDGQESPAERSPAPAPNPRQPRAIDASPVKLAITNPLFEAAPLRKQ
ncbi:MAG TPA: HD domain-containing protein [Tepidisphaeraceae bacterium]|jgi:3'-5' exoribonuclease